MKALDPDWIRIQYGCIGIQPKMLDPDPDEMNVDPQPCIFQLTLIFLCFTALVYLFKMIFLKFIILFQLGIQFLKSCVLRSGTMETHGMVGDYGIGSPFVQTKGINGHDNNNQVQGRVPCLHI